jgi:glycerol-3-phosphate acyltransferase PlsY
MEANIGIISTLSISALLFGYLLGSIPFGLIFARMAGLGDIRKIGSGNIGATNVLRSGRKGVAAATLLADMLKGVIAVWVALRFGLEAGLLAGLGAFLGHCFPIWLKFKGGKGVATYIGVLVVMSWKAAAIFAVVWLLIAAITRYSSLAALVASLTIVAGLFWLNMNQVGYLFALMTVLIWIFHRANISRLLAGTEGKIGSKG